MHSKCLWSALVVSACLAVACSEEMTRVEPEAAATALPEDAASPGTCADRSPTRRVYFGDLHTHTARSMDAWTFDVRVTPAGAYAFARGEPVRLPPLDETGRGTRVAQLARPLDFAAVTDHGELLAETALCTREDSAAYATTTCKAYREGSGTSGLARRMRMLALAHLVMAPKPTRYEQICGDDGQRCREAGTALWGEARDAAEEWNDPCRFTTFVGYEYTASTLANNLHRNVIFRNGNVPALPVTYFDEPTPLGLWQTLRSTCIDAGEDCDVLAIPHNANFSNGRMFAVEYPGAATPEEQAAQAELRASIEPLVEIMQIKGDSECRNGLSGVFGGPDELCDFEKIPAVYAAPRECDEAMAAASGAFQRVDLNAPDWERQMGVILRQIRGGGRCVSRLDFARYVLVEGLVEAGRIGVNPYKHGFIASTDNHTGTPGAVDERSYRGRSWLEGATPEERQRNRRAGVGDARRTRNPGGLVAVWAEENTRDSLFDAMQRRETYGTSGPRIVARFFGGWSYPEDLCSDPDLVASGYAAGVPMGGDLPARPPEAGAPTFVVSALRDPGTVEMPGTPLERVQIVKGWVDDEGRAHQAVHDVVTPEESGASVDLATCAVQGPGLDSACAVWTDPDFDPSRRAVYYARVLENPSCRYSTFQCLASPEGARPQHCADPDVPRTIQERAWTSPIWYEPANAGRADAT